MITWHTLLPVRLALQRHTSCCGSAYAALRCGTPYLHPRRTAAHTMPDLHLTRNATTLHRSLVLAPWTPLQLAWFVLRCRSVGLPVTVRRLTYRIALPGLPLHSTAISLDLPRFADARTRSSSVPDSTYPFFCYYPRIATMVCHSLQTPFLPCLPSHCNLWLQTYGFTGSTTLHCIRFTPWFCRYTRLTCPCRYCRLPSITVDLQFWFWTPWFSGWLCRL